MPLPNTFKDNISTLLPKADYGLRIPKAGFDALTAADSDLLYNSSWPSLQIAKVVPITKTSSPYTAVPHGLKFPTVAFVMGGSDTNAIMRGCNTDDTNVYVRTDFSTGNIGDVMGTLVIYVLDVSTDIEYSYTATSSNSPLYDRDYGIKMVKPGKSIDSIELRDYILHSRCGSPLVLAVKTEATVNPVNSTTVQYTSKLGYPTLNFGYAGIPGGTVDFNITYGNKAYRFAPQGGQAAPIAFTDGFTVYVPIYADSGARASVVCLRSPMFAVTNTAQVNY